MIVVNLDVMLAKRKISSGELAARIGITQANLSVLKTGKAKAVRFSTLESICKELDCQPGDILKFILRRRISCRPLHRNMFRLNLKRCILRLIKKINASCRCL